MSIDSATQRLNTAVDDLEAKVTKRLAALESENQQLRRERDQLRATAQVAIVPSEGNHERYAALERRTAEYRAALTSSLKNIDSLITRVSGVTKQEI
jgi:chromosome segregation ATPase